MERNPVFCDIENVLFKHQGGTVCHREVMQKNILICVYCENSACQIICLVWKWIEVKPNPMLAWFVNVESVGGFFRENSCGAIQRLRGRCYIGRGIGSD